MTNTFPLPFLTSVQLFYKGQYTVTPKKVGKIFHEKIEGKFRIPFVSCTLFFANKKKRAKIFVWRFIISTHSTNCVLILTSGIVFDQSDNVFDCCTIKTYPLHRLIYREYLNFTLVSIFPRCDVV